MGVEERQEDSPARWAIARFRATAGAAFVLRADERSATDVRTRSSAGPSRSVADDDLQVVGRLGEDRAKRLVDVLPALKAGMRTLARGIDPGGGPSTVLSSGSSTTRAGWGRYPLRWFAASAFAQCSTRCSRGADVCGGRTRSGTGQLIPPASRPSSRLSSATADVATSSRPLPATPGVLRPEANLRRRDASAAAAADKPDGQRPLTTSYCRRHGRNEHEAGPGRHAVSPAPARSTGRMRTWPERRTL